MEAARKMMQVMRGAFLVSIILYAVVAKILPAATAPNVVIYRAIALLAVVDVAIIFVCRRMMVRPAEGVLASHPEDPAALARWRTGYLITYALSEAAALYGLVLHFLGFNLVQVAPFLITGFVLILFYAPRTPAQAR